jgi:hypothetical protein
MTKLPRAISRVKWLNGEKTTVSKTISVLILRIWFYFVLKRVPRLAYLTKLLPLCSLRRTEQEGEVTMTGEQTRVWKITVVAYLKAKGSLRAKEFQEI